MKRGMTNLRKTSIFDSKEQEKNIKKGKTPLLKLINQRKKELKKNTHNGDSETKQYKKSHTKLEPSVNK